MATLNEIPVADISLLTYFPEAKSYHAALKDWIKQGLVPERRLTKDETSLKYAFDHIEAISFRGFPQRGKVYCGEALVEVAGKWISFELAVHAVVASYGMGKKRKSERAKLSQLVDGLYLRAGGFSGTDMLLLTCYAKVSVNSLRVTGPLVGPLLAIGVRLTEDGRIAFTAVGESIGVNMGRAYPASSVDYSHIAKMIYDGGANRILAAVAFDQITNPSPRLSLIK